MPAEPDAGPTGAAGHRASGASAANSPPLTLLRLKTRADFLRAQRGIRRRERGLILEGCTSPVGLTAGQTVRVGFTASRKVGGAVERNRAKRRLRAVAAAVLPLYGMAGNDYVLVAKTETLSRPFDGLLADLCVALRAANSRLGRPAGDG